LPQFLSDLWSAVHPYLDGSWLDGMSLLCAIVYAETRRRKRKTHKKVICRETGIDIANGVGIFPLFVLSLTTFSSFMLPRLLEANKLILSVAGVVALLAILDE
jgi:hypothetical protein